MNDLVTIVVPVYNVEHYLEKCVESIIKQTYKNIEVILVDDGSSDNSARMCDELSLGDERIRVIHKSNGGLSDARNAALEIASGKYVTFVDSDDYIHEDYVSYLCYLLEKYNADLSICEFDYITPEGKRINHPLDNEKEMKFDQLRSIRILLKQKLYSNSSSGKLFKMSDFRNVRFPYGKLYEDTATIYKLFMKASTVAFGARPLYYYVYRASSISKSGFSVKQLDSIRNTEQMIADILAVFPKLKTACKCRLLDPCIGMLKKISKEDNPDEYNYIIGRIHRIRRSVLFSKEATLKRRIYAFLSYFGEGFFVGFIKKR